MVSRDIWPPGTLQCRQHPGSMADRRRSAITGAGLKAVVSFRRAVPFGWMELARRRVWELRPPSFGTYHRCPYPTDHIFDFASRANYMPNPIFSSERYPIGELERRFIWPGSAYRTRCIFQPVHFPVSTARKSNCIAFVTTVFPSCGYSPTCVAYT